MEGDRKHEERRKAPREKGRGSQGELQKEFRVSLRPLKTRNPGITMFEGQGESELGI